DSPVKRGVHGIAAPGEDEDPAVISAGEAKQFASLGSRSRERQSVKIGLGPGITEADALDARKSTANDFRKANLADARSAIGQPGSERRRHDPANLVVAVTVEACGIFAQDVEIDPAVDVLDASVKTRIDI